MKKYDLFLPFFVLLFSLLACEQKADAPSAPAVEGPVRIDTVARLADQISQSARLYTTEFQIHKIVTHSDVARLSGNVLSLPVNVEVSTGERKVAIPIDVTVKAYVDFAAFSADDIHLENGHLTLRLPDPKLTVTASRINNKDVRQYVDLTRSTFSDAEVLDFARQGTDSIVSHLDKADLMQTSRKSVRRALLPMLRHAGFKDENVSIDFRPELKAEALKLQIEI